MADKELQPIRNAANGVAPYQASQGTPDGETFLARWKEFLPLYIKGGRPSSDTMKNYISSIDQFLDWCAEQSCHPLGIRDMQMRLYLHWLRGRSYKEDSIAAKIIAIRNFYMAARKIGVISDNPVKDIAVYQSNEELINYFTPTQLYEIEQAINQEENLFRRHRNTCMLYLMGVEGLRNIEVHRINQEDIDWEHGIILIHGKGHDRTIFPCKDTFKHLDEYLNICPIKDDIKQENGHTPLFLSDSNLNLWGRISRNGIRYVMNHILEIAGYKKAGISCHVFRHSTGTNLYAATKDIRLVQDVLGHQNPKTTARYAHLQERMTKRSTAAIVPQKEPAEQEKI